MRLRQFELLTRRRWSVLEAAVVAVASVAVAFAVYGSHVVRGGFILDDWAFASEVALHKDKEGIVGLSDRLFSLHTALMSAGGRPLGALYFATTHDLFGMHAGLFLALAVLLASVVSGLFFVVLRELGIERLHAAAMSLLVLVFPAADATRLWSSGSVGLGAMLFFLLGLVLALRGLEASGSRAVLLHAASLACYGLGLIQYEIFAGVLLATVGIYRLRARWRPAILRWLADLAVLAAVALYVRAHTEKQVSSPHDMLDRVWTLQSEARTVLGELGIQDGDRRFPAPAVALALLVALVVARVLPRRDAAREQIERWLLVAGAGIAVVGLGYLPFVATSYDFYLPSLPGIANRINLLAAFGYVLLIYAIGVLVVSLAVVALRCWRPSLAVAGTTAAVAVCGTLVVGAAWTRAVRTDIHDYSRAYALERQTLDALRVVPPPPRGTWVYTFGTPEEAAPYVPAFSRTWDLTGAIRVLWHDGTLTGVPGVLVARTRYANAGRASGLKCNGHSVLRIGAGYSPGGDPTPYGRTLFVDVPKRQYALIRNESDCHRELARIRHYLG